MTPAPPRAHYSVLEAVTVIATVVLAMALISPGVSALGLRGFALIQALAIGGPLIAFPALLRIRPGHAARMLGMRAPTARALAGAGLIGLSMWYVNAAWISRLTPAVESKAMEQLTLVSNQHGLAWTLVVLAAFPAVFEELLMRGVLARALRPSFGLIGAACASGLVFGVFHFSIPQLLPTTSLGVVLGIVALRTGCIWPAVVIHFLNNVSALTVSRTNSLKGIINAHPAEATVLAVTAIGVGLFLIFQSSSADSNQTS